MQLQKRKRSVAKEEAKSNKVKGGKKIVQPRGLKEETKSSSAPPKQVKQPSIKDSFVKVSKK